MAADLAGAIPGRAIWGVILTHPLLGLPTSPQGTHYLHAGDTAVSSHQLKPSLANGV